MDIVLGKAILYAYSHVDEVCVEIDGYMMEKALSSVDVNTPTIDQCVEIVRYQWQKASLIELKEKVTQILSKLPREKMLCLRYKYFKDLSDEEVLELGKKNRNYYRRQNVLIQWFCKRLEVKGIDEDWITENLLPITFIKSIVKVARAEEKLEENCESQIKENEKAVKEKKSEMSVEVVKKAKAKIA